ncbi:VWA domain-containing protein [Candidatus Saccharibacteria bacterium]|nr:VWA domain-containing protein [Candidatus Saccharibacteria bacterium]
MFFFFVLLFCSAIFVATANADVTIEGDPNPYNVAIGDTLSVTSRTSLQVGENFVKWEIVSGTGTFVDKFADSTGFIPSSDPVVIRRETQILPIYEISELPTTFYFNENSAKIPQNGLYGVRMFFETGNGGDYALLYKTGQPVNVVYYYEDSTFAKNTPDDATYTFYMQRDCRNGRCVIKTPPKTKVYVFVYLPPGPNSDMEDALTVQMVPSHTLQLTRTGSGTVYLSCLDTLMSTCKWAMDSDTIQLGCYPDRGLAFDRWEVASGPCSILDSSIQTAKVINMTGDCKVNAVFRNGIVYPITDVSTEYNFHKHVYSQQNASLGPGVRLSFVAPTTGTYNIIVTNGFSQDRFFYHRYTGFFAREEISKEVIDNYVDTVSLVAGDTVGVIVYNDLKTDSVFFINYTMQQAYRLSLSQDGHGKVSPSGGYSPAYANTRYPISTEANTGYRFSDWQIVSGSAVIDDKYARNTFVSISSNSELKATFRPVSICTLSTKKKTFNYEKDYYDESTLSAIRLTWTPPDSAYYVLRFDPVDDLDAVVYGYGTDGTFTNPISFASASQAIGLTVKGTPNVPLYWVIQDYSSGIPNKSFTAWVAASPYVLKVKASKEGVIEPSNTIYTTPNFDTPVTAVPHVGYKFKSWEKVKGKMTISSLYNAKTSVVLVDSVCTIKATYTKDKTVEPILSISNLDLSNYPEICTYVSIVDSKTGRPFNGLGSDDIDLTQDGQKIRPQVTTTKALGGVSVVIVVDESPSMDENNRMQKAKDAIRSFIFNMGPYDRTAIVGFRGYEDSTFVHQKMTSDKKLLLNAVNTLITKGYGTNVLNGAYDGLMEIVNETNTTAVIILSDGENNAGITDISVVTDEAKRKNTSIYSIALETRTTSPLKELAENTGGMFVSASDASELADIYADMRNNILSQHIICYQTPDTIPNGDVHNVVIGMTFNKRTTKDSVQWSEKSIPPKVDLTEDTWDKIRKSQQANNSITISAYVTTSLSIKNANIFLRNSNTGNTQFTSYSMRHVKDSLWEYTVPANLVVAPGIDFYIIATDTAGQSGKSPRITNPSLEPYTIFVDNDIPEIKEVSIVCEDSTSDLKTFTFQLTDHDGIFGAQLFYKGEDDVIYQVNSFANTYVGDTWTTRVPMNIIEYAGFRYYLRVTDALGASVRYPETGFLTTDACEEKDVILEPEDSSFVDSIPKDSVPKDSNMVPSDTVPEDSLAPSPRDSIVYSLLADTAEIYDKDLDGLADFVRVHFKEERRDNITGVDSIFWNSNRGEWRYVPSGKMKQNRSDGKWFEGYINKPYKYGLTKADTVRKPFLAFTTIYSDKMENVMLRDRVGAVPARATKFLGKVGLKEYMDPNSEIPPDTLVIWMSEPIRNVGKERGWENLFRYSESCEDTVSQPLSMKEAPIIRDNGQLWTVLLDGIFVKDGACLFTDPEASYEDQAGNPMGRGGIKIDGEDGKIYLGEVRPLQAVSGIGETPQWIPPEGAGWEPLPDTLSAISVKSSMPYTAEVYIFSAISTYVTHFKQKFGYDGEMEQSVRGKASDLFRQGFLHWNNRSEKGRKVGSGIYIWKIFFKFEDGHKETRVVKTGIYRRGSRK